MIVKREVKARALLSSLPVNSLPFSSPCVSASVHPPLYFNPLPSVKKKIREHFKDHRTSDDRIGSFSKMYRDVSQMGVEHSFVDGKIPYAVIRKNINLDWRTFESRAQVLETFGAWTLEKDGVRVHSFTAGQPRYRTAQAIAERDERRRAQAAARQAKCRRLKKLEKDRRESIDHLLENPPQHLSLVPPMPTDFDDDCRSFLSLPEDDLIENDLHDSQAESENSEISSVACEIVTRPGFKQNCVTHSVQPTVTPLTATPLESTPIESKTVKNKNDSKTNPSMVPQPEILRQDHLPRPVEGPCSSLLKADFQKILEPFEAKPVESKSTAPLGKDADRESSAERTADGRPVLSDEELRRRLGSDTFSIIEKLSKQTPRQEVAPSLIVTRRAPEPLSKPIQRPPARTGPNQLTPLKIPPIPSGPPITQPEASHLLSQHPGLPDVARVLADMRVDRALVVEAIGIFADANQAGKIAKSPAGYFMTVVGNLRRDRNTS